MHFEGTGIYTEKLKKKANILKGEKKKHMGLRCDLNGIKN